jgi:hypothetical protein
MKRKYVSIRVSGEEQNMVFLLTGHKILTSVSNEVSIGNLSTTL